MQQDLTALRGKAILRDWLAPQTLETFFSEIWAKSPHHFTGHAKNRFVDIISAEDISAFLDSDILPAHYLKVVEKERILGRHLWAKLETRREFDALHIVDRDRLFDLFDKGVSIIIGAAELHFPKLKECCSALQAHFGFRVQANIYITPAYAQGLPLHYDTHDVMVAQIKGVKEWIIGGRPVPEPTKNQFYAGQETQIDQSDQCFLLKQGDLFYVPRGWLHTVRSREASSIHITFGLHQPMLSDVLEDLAKAASDKPEYRLRQPLPGASGEDWQAFKSQMSRLLHEMSTPSVKATTGAKTTNDFIKHLGNQSLSGDDRVQSCLNASPAIIRQGQEIFLVSHKSNLSFPHFLEKPIRTFLSGEPVRINSVDGLLNETGKLELATKMIRAGFLNTYSPPDENEK